MKLNGNCIRSVAECLGSPYCTGNFWATCNKVRLATPAIKDKYLHCFEFCKRCCKQGDLAGLDMIYKTHAYYSLPYNSMCVWAAAKLQNTVLHWIMARYKNFDTYAMLCGAAKSGSVEQLRHVFSITKQDMDKVTSWLLEEHAARSGEMAMCKEVMKITRASTMKYFLIGAAQGGHVGLCQTFISLGADNFDAMVHYSTFKDSIEIFELGVKHLGLEHCAAICQSFAKEKLATHIRNRLKTDI